MRASWKREYRRTAGLFILGLALWALFIYWQGEFTLSGLSQALLALLTLNFDEIGTPYSSLFLDIVLFLASGILGILFFAHFILPIKEAHNIFAIARLIGRSIFGQRPKALILNNGAQKFAPSNNRNIKPDMALLDNGSAAVLQGEAGLKRAIGPGLTFTHASEALVGALDLRVQRRAWGPIPEDETFAPEKHNEELDIFRARKARRQQTSAFTQDGIEIVPRIEVDFHIDGGTKSGNAPYPFKAEFVLAALTQKIETSIKLADEQLGHLDWDQLALHLATRLWREALAQFNLHDLFSTESEDEDAMTGIERIINFINTRLTEAIVPESFSAKGESTRNTSSPEYQLLRSRGLRVLKVRIRETHLDPLRDEMNLVNEWSDAWAMSKIQSGIKDEYRNEEKERSGQESAAADFVRIVSAPLFGRLKETDGKSVLPPDKSESLSLLLKGSLEGASRLPSLEPKISQRLRHLANMIAEQNGQPG
jgi:hypothetical protein